jgi:hypothetical protein
MQLRTAKENEDLDRDMNYFQNTEQYWFSIQISPVTFNEYHTKWINKGMGMQV